jgi:excisionase family DNA binding protein
MATSNEQAPLTVGLKGASVLTSLSERGLRKLASQGKLPSIKVGRRLLFRVTDLEQFLTAHERKTAVEGKTAAAKVRQALTELAAAKRLPVN